MNMYNKEKNKSPRFTPIKIIFMVLVFAVIFSALSALVMVLWNAILPDTVGVKPLNIWKAAGLLVLAKILFGGLGRIFGTRKYKNRKEWRKKWMQMSPEERKEARNRWKEHCRKRKED